MEHNKCVFFLYYRMEYLSDDIIRDAREELKIEQFFFFLTMENFKHIQK